MQNEILLSQSAIAKLIGGVREDSPFLPRAAALGIPCLHFTTYVTNNNKVVPRSDWGGLGMGETVAFERFDRVQRGVLTLGRINYTLAVRHVIFGPDSIDFVFWGQRGDARPGPGRALHTRT